MPTPQTTQDRIERLEALCGRCVLLVWSPWLWLILPLVYAISAPSWTIPSGFASAAADVWIGVFIALLLASVGAAFGMFWAVGRIEETCAQALNSGTLSWLPCAPRRRSRIRVVATRGVDARVVLSLAPAPVRWTMQALCGALILSLASSFAATWPPSRRDVVDLLLGLAVFAGFFGPAWLFASWIWVTRVHCAGTSLLIRRSRGPWKFGPLRARTVEVPLPCLMRIGARGAELRSRDRVAVVVPLPESAHGVWQAERLRGQLEEALGVPITFHD